MAPPQMSVIRRRLQSIGFATTGNSPLRASKLGVRIVVDPFGFCSSNKDLSDAILPVLSELHGTEPAKVAYKVLRDSYFASQRRGNKLLVRFTPRLESESHWEELRAKGSCALTPDERAVYSTVLSSGTSLTPLVTDFPVEGSAVRRIGSRQYYYSRLEPAVAASTLRGMGSIDERNTYLPRGSVLSLTPASLPKKELRSLFEELGDWCFFSLKQTRQKV
jgi:hypothetical protein